MWNFQGLVNEKQWKFSRETNLRGDILLFGLGNSRICNRVLRNLWGLDFALSRISAIVEAKNLYFQGLFRRFSKIAH